MVLSPVSLLAIALILAALAVAWSRRFLAAGALALANVLVFVLTAWGPRITLASGARIPTIQAELGLWSPNLAGDPALGALQLLTSMFVHADLLHLFSNLLILLAFALPFEERIGHRPFVLLYLAAGLVGALAQVAVSTGPILLMGASGAVFGVIGAFAAAYPNLIVPLPLPLFIVMFFVRMRVWIAATAFGALELLRVSLSTAGDSTAYFAHFGGLAAGILMGLTVVKKSAPAARRPVAVDLGALTPFARAAGTSAALAQMKSNHDEPQIFQAWLDRFFRTASCPNCGHKVMPRHHGEIVCTQGHRFDVRRDRRSPIAA
jgi:membrane associated rhomboid family serine protease